MLKMVPVKAGIYCMPWHLRGSEQEPVRGRACCYCGRDVAVPVSKKHWNAECIYCGLNRGELPLTEAEAYEADVPVSFQSVTPTA